MIMYAYPGSPLSPNLMPKMSLPLLWALLYLIPQYHMHQLPQESPRNLGISICCNLRTFSIIHTKSLSLKKKLSIKKVGLELGIIACMQHSHDIKHVHTVQTCVWIQHQYTVASEIRDSAHTVYWHDLVRSLMPDIFVEPNIGVLQQFRLQ